MTVAVLSDLSAVVILRPKSAKTIFIFCHCQTSFKNDCIRLDSSGIFNSGNKEAIKASVFNQCYC